jgi:ABC-type transport system involved in cytochrome bd biosynthesis fused ATPase/permease subunit
MTILAIAHRSSLIASADHVIHLDNGKLAGAPHMRSDDSDRWIRAAMAND